jgi:hypothetical protein
MLSSLSRLPARALIFNLIASAALIGLGYALLRVPAWDFGRSFAMLSLAFLAGVFGNFEHFETFKASASGIEARTREVVQQAEVAIRQLHELAAGIGSVLVNMVVGEGRMGANQHSIGKTDSVERDARKAAIMDLMKKLGLPDDLQFQVESSDRKYVLADYEIAAVIRGSRAIKGRFSEEQEKDWTRFVTSTYDMDHLHSPETIRAYFIKHDLMNSGTEEILKDYEYYREHSRHRRPDVWRLRGNWIEQAAD